MDLSLEKLDAVRLAMEVATTVQEIKNVLDLAKAAEVYAQQHRLGKELELKTEEYVLRAERKLGEMLAKARKAGQLDRGGRPPKKPVDGDDRFSLDDAGISRDLSSRAQKIAAVPQEQFEKAISEGKEKGNLSKNMFKKKKAKGSKAAPKTNAPKEHDLAPQIIALSDAGKSQAAIAEELGTTARQVRHVLEEEAIRRKAKADPNVTRDMLSMTAQQKFDRAIEQEKKRLGISFWDAVNAKVKELLESTIGPRHEKEQRQAKFIMEHRTGVMTRKEFNQIRACLHTDRNATPAELNAAFSLFTSFEKYLLKEKESPTEWQGLPKTAAEWEEMRRKATERRKQARAAKKGGTNNATAPTK